MKWPYTLMLSLVLIGAYVIYKKHESYVAPQAPYYAHPETTVFAFDLHGVVFTKDYPEMFHKACTAPLSMQAVLTAINPMFWIRVSYLLYTRDSVEELIEKLSQTYPVITNYKELALEIANAQQPIEGTVTILKKLKMQGFRLLIFSNIGVTAFHKLRNKFPDIFSYFDGYLVAEPSDNWLQKPDRQAYEKFMKKFDLRANSIIFVDDRLQNIKAAQKLGIYSIYFTSATDLEQKLYNLNGLAL